MDKLDWNQLRAFLETAETGSLSAAARKLGLTQPTLSRQVAAIEQRMGVTLFERVGKAMALTATGLDLLEHARAMGAAAEALGLAATGRSQAVGGVVSVSASDAVASFLLPPLVRRLREQEPGIVVDVIPSNAFSDLLRREADIAVRHAKPEQPELIARLVREASAHFYASEDWVQAHGHPRRAEEAARLPFVGSDRAGRYLAYLQHHGLPVTEANFTAYADHTVAHWALVRQGLGIGAMMEEIAQDTPGVVRVLDEVPPVRFPIWLVSHRELRTARRIRVVFEALAQGLQAG
ncbi:DNA-binding transcriptional LysR family regulator [Acidovorax soli]|jgi:DNA-binding transcriptional LysR family regulator|uniref:DNA-binding transcriptional LysR family regulator n=1 Tax=Acidovorax soli TaxID=592050 RepID=A0A7X0PHA6_9BURK|nr:LysR family transcriptional regulator [Acidovorax soli]MBB6561866.1 DNA-binding transcriptional LysR family regulator [Acidovorax soli]